MKTWREKVDGLKNEPQFALLGTTVEALCEEAFSVALKEATEIVLDANFECPCCGVRDLPHLDECTFASDWPETEEEWRRWPLAAAAIRKLKDANARP